jgi:DNA recombination protein RmuC
MEAMIARIAGQDVALADAVLAAFGLALVMLVLATIVLVRFARARRRAEAAAAMGAAELESQVGALLQAQSEMTGRMQTMAEIFGERQAELNRAVSERLDGMGHRLSQSVGEATKHTQENLKKLHERLAVLDAAQKNITDLTGQVTTLTNILDNKQSRGAFGQGRMEAIIADNLPNSAYSFQATLQSGARPDCLIFMPNDAPPLVVDAKFPLEGYNAAKAASSPQALKSAQAQFRGDVIKHVKDIKERYLIPGETQDTAFMFVPSETIFAEIQENFDAIVQRAHKARVMIVSPSLLMLSIQVIQALLRDQRLAEQAGVIQGEVLHLMEDIGRLDDRVRKLQTHFSQAQKDVDLILTSTDKVTKRSRRIEGLGFGEVAEDKEEITSESSPEPRLAARN